MLPILQQDDGLAGGLKRKRSMLRRADDAHRNLAVSDAICGVKFSKLKAHAQKAGEGCIKRGLGDLTIRHGGWNEGAEFLVGKIAAGIH